MSEKIYIFGAGAYGKAALYELEHKGERLVSFLDNDKTKREREILHGVLCMLPRDVSESERKNVTVVIANKKSDARAAIREQLSLMGFCNIYDYGEREYDATCMTLTDEEYIRMRWEIMMGKRTLDLEHPRTFDEKIQWLKLHDRDPLHTILVDKYAVKKWVADKIGDEYVIPTLGVWERFDDIDFDALPDKFVLKCTHDSGSIVFCCGKKQFDIDAAREKLTKCLAQNYFWVTREWPYKDVPPRIIAEPYIVDESGYELKDYKVQVFGGEPKFIQVDFGRFSDHRRNLYDCEWNYIPAMILYPTAPEHIAKPECLDDMLNLARKLSEGMIYVRTDFYAIHHKVYFGEMTFHHGSGYENIEPPEFEKRMSDWMHLPLVAE